MNYNSIQRRYPPAKSRINHGFINQIIQEKSAVVDQNFGIMAQSVETILGVDLIRSEDKEYLKSKLSSVLDTLDQTDSIKFDSKNSRYTIQNALGEAAKDPEVLKQLANTQKIRQIQAFQQKRAEKGDLNAVNFQSAYNDAGVDAYMSGLSSDLGSFNYLEYTDVDKKVRDLSKEWQALKPDMDISMPDGKGGVYTRKKSQLTQAEWMSKISTGLDANDIAQMKINGAAMYGFDDNRALQDLENKKLEAIQPTLDSIEDLKSKLHLADPAKKQQLQNQIEDLNTINKQTLAQFDKIGTTAKEIGGFYIQNATINNMAAFMAKASDVSYKGVDQAYFKNKEASEKITGKVTDQAGNSIIDYTGDGVSDIQSSAIPKAFSEEQNQIDYETVFMDDLKATENSIQVEVQGIYNSIEDPELKKSIDTYRKQRFDETGDDNQALTDAIVKYAGSDDLNINLFKKESLMGKIAETEARHTAINNSADKAISNALEPNKIFEEIYKNDTNIRIHGVDSNVTFKEYLNSYKSSSFPTGIKTKEQFSAFLNSDEGKQVRASLLIQSSENLWFGDEPVEEQDVASRPRQVPYMSVDKTSRIRFNEIEKLTGESLDVVYEGEVVKLSKVPNGKIVRVLNYKKEKNSLFGSETTSDPNTFISRGLDGIRQGGNALWTDRIATEDSELMSLLGNEALKNSYDAELNIQGARIPGSSAITIQGDRGEKASRFKSELQAIIPNFEFATKESEVTLIKMNANEYAVYEAKKTKKKSLFGEEEVDVKTSFSEPVAVVTLDQINSAQSGYLRNAIDFQEQEQAIEFALDRKYTSPPINYKKNSVDTEKQLIEYLGVNNPMSVYASKESFIKTVKNNYKDPLKTQIAQTIVDNSNTFQVNFESAKVGENGGIGKLNINLANGDTLYSMDVKKADAANYLKYVQVIPEAFLSMAAENIIENNDNETWLKIAKAIQK